MSMDGGRIYRALGLDVSCVTAQIKAMSRITHQIRPRPPFNPAKLATQLQPSTPALQPQPPKPVCEALPRPPFSRHLLQSPSLSKSNPFPPPQSASLKQSHPQSQNSCTPLLEPSNPTLHSPQLNQIGTEQRCTTLARSPAPSLEV